MKLNTKQIFVIFLSLFICTSCAGKKNLTKNKNQQKVNEVPPLPDISSPNSLNSDLNNNTSVSGDLNARVAYLEELLNSYQVQSMALDSPITFFNKKILLTNGSMLYGNIVFQDENLIQLETLIGTLAIEKNTVMRVVDQTVSVLNDEDKMIEINTQSEIQEDVEYGSNQNSAEVILLGDFKEEKDSNQNTILSGQVKNMGSKRADFAKITFTIYRNKSYESVPVEYTAFINGSSVSFDNDAISTSSLFSDEVGDFSILIPSDFGPFVSYTYRIDWEEYE